MWELSSAQPLPADVTVTAARCDPGLLTWRTSELTVRLRLEEAGDLAAPWNSPGRNGEKGTSTG